MSLDQYYAVLGLPVRSSKSAVKKAYRRLAMQWHPDRNKASNAQQKFMQITKAYDVIMSGKLPFKPLVVRPKRKKTAEEKWGNVQHPPKNHKDFKEWYKVKKNKRERYTTLTYDAFVEQIDFEKKNLFFFGGFFSAIGGIVLFVALIMLISIIGVENKYKSMLLVGNVFIVSIIFVAIGLILRRYFYSTTKKNYQEYLKEEQLKKNTNR